MFIDDHDVGRGQYFLADRSVWRRIEHRWYANVTCLRERCRNGCIWCFKLSVNQTRVLKSVGFRMNMVGRELRVGPRINRYPVFSISLNEAYASAGSCIDGENHGRIQSQIGKGLLHEMASGIVADSERPVHRHAKSMSGQCHVETLAARFHDKAGSFQRLAGFRATHHPRTAGDHKASNDKNGRGFGAGGRDWHVGTFARIVDRVQPLYIRHFRMKDTRTLSDTTPQAGNAPHEPFHRLLSLGRDTAHPLYLQLEEQIAALIDAGQLPPGATLPPERRLAEALGISRATVQTSYNALRLRGLLGGRGRRGSVIQAGHSGRMAPGMDRLKGFTQEMEEMGRIPSSRVLERRILSDRSMASIFGLQSDARFLHLRRVRYGDEQPLTVESAWYSLDIAPQLADTDPFGSIYAELSRTGLPLDYCDQSIETAMPNETEGSIFGFEKAVPCLLIKRRSYIKTGAMVEYVEGLFRGDAYVYRLRLSA